MKAIISLISNHIMFWFYVVITIFCCIIIICILNYVRQSSYRTWKSLKERNKKYYKFAIQRRYIKRIERDFEWSKYRDDIGIYFVKDKIRCKNCGSFNTHVLDYPIDEIDLICNRCQKFFSL